MLLVGGGVLGLGLVINLVATFLSDGVGGPLRWLVPPAIALIAAMVVALLDAVSPEEGPAGSRLDAVSAEERPARGRVHAGSAEERPTRGRLDAVSAGERPARGRLDVPVVVAIVAVLVGVGVGGFALTAGVEYAAGYITGKESGEDRLVKPVARTGAGLTLTVENVTYTSHFTRVEVAASNRGDQPLSLSIEDSAFTGADGNSLTADGFRSQWPGSVGPGDVVRGTITFKGHLPEGLTAATLTLKSGATTFTVPGIALSN
ncbi:hypothetical protein [Kribbella swartbergensis]